MAAAVYVSPGKRLWDALNSHQVDLLTSLLHQFVSSSSMDNVLEYRGDHAQRTLLATVIFYENLTMAKLLLEFGANVDSRDKHEFTPLMLAVSEGSYSLSKLLIEAGADVNACSSSLQTPLLLAVLNGHYDITKLLLSSSAAIGYGRKSVGHLAVCSAAGRGDLSVVRLLVEQGVDVSTKEQCISEALYCATCGKQSKIMEYILQFHADINFISPRDKTTLMMASNHLETLLLLMDHGADINFTNEEGKTALMNSVICRDAMAFENLLGFDPDINIADEDGWTAFMYSVVNATNANDTFIADLISAGANLTVKNRQGRTALDMAQAKDHEMYQRILVLSKQ